MLQDGSGEVDFVEFYTWWLRSKGKDPSSALVVSASAEEAFSIVPFK